MIACYIREIEIFLPRGKLSNQAIEARFPEWPAAKIEEKLGVRERAIAGPDEYVSDLAVGAANRIFETGRCAREEIDFLMICTQTPDQLAPTTACIVQERLGLPARIGAIDINQGCSGYVYGLSLAKGLIESGQSRKVLFITADTYTKFIEPQDKNLVTLFGDGAAATLLSNRPDQSRSFVGAFILETDGKGANNLAMRGTGARALKETGRLYMNGPEIFNFALKTVPPVVKALLEADKTTAAEVDLFVFHQANCYMLEHLRKKLNIPAEKFVISMAETGNTVSSTIPIALKEALAQGRLKSGMKLLLLGFGVGYSTAGAIVNWVS